MAVVSDFTCLGPFRIESCGNACRIENRGCFFTEPLSAVWDLTASAFSKFFSLQVS